MPRSARPFGVVSTTITMIWAPTPTPELQFETKHDRQMMNSETIFISYAREDLELAREIYFELRRAGLKPWLDKEDMLPGETWRSRIDQIIRSSRYFVALLSSNSLTKKGYVQKELKVALSVLDELPAAEIFIIPVRIDECEPRDERISSLNWIDLCDPREDLIKRITALVKRRDGDSLRINYHYNYGELLACKTFEASKVVGDIVDGRPRLLRNGEEVADDSMFASVGLEERGRLYKLDLFWYTDDNIYGSHYLVSYHFGMNECEPEKAWQITESEVEDELGRRCPEIMKIIGFDELGVKNGNDAIDPAQPMSRAIMRYFVAPGDTFLILAIRDDNWNRSLASVTRYGQEVSDLIARMEKNIRERKKKSRSRQEHEVAK